MAQRIVHPEWRRYYESTKYPFSDAATLVNAAGDFFGESVLLDASLYPVGGVNGMYLSKVTVESELCTLVVGDDDTDELASASFDITAPPDLVRVYDTVGRPAGLFVSEANRLATFQSWSLGDHLFTQEQTEFVARVCVPTPEVGLRGFILEDGTVFTGDVWIVGEDGVVVSRELFDTNAGAFSANPRTYEVIRIDIIGDPLFRRRLCGQAFVTPRFLETVTFQYGEQLVICGPDRSGNLSITAGSGLLALPALRITTRNNAVVFDISGEVDANLLN